MKKIRNLLIITFIGAVLGILAASLFNKTYSYGASSYITGEAGSYVLQFYDIDSGTDISCSAAQEFYGVTKYQRKKKSSSYIYFYNCKQTTKSKYEDGYPKEIADIRAKNKGDSAIRVTDTASAKKAYDTLYQNHRTGTFTLEFAENETIDWNAVENYVLTKYGVTNYKTNYYSYSVKGEWEPIRYGLPDKSNISSGTVEVDMWRLRITGDELKVTEAFVNKLLPLLQGDGSDYQKILASYQYLKQYTTYLVDDGFSNGVASNTSIYDAFIERQTTCIGYSIAFSYLMDRLGIESYIVDQITTNDAANESFASVHTYNVVKLDGKFYKLDLTGGAFLKGLSSSTLSDTKLPISTSAYNTSGKKTTWSFNTSTINGYLSSAKATKTTTTNKIYLTTTTRKTTSVKATSGATTTKKKTTTSRETTTSKAPTKPITTTTTRNTGSYTTTTTNKYTKETTLTNGTTKKTTTRTNQHGEIIYDPTTGNKKTTTTKTNRPQGSKTTTKLTEEEIEKKKEKDTVNFFLINIGVAVIIVYIVYRKYKKQKRLKNYNDDISDILDKYRGR